MRRVKFESMAKRSSNKNQGTRKKNFCFGCGPDNPDGMHLKFRYDKKKACVICKVKLGSRFAGPPGYCHGGIIATLLDEIMAKLNKPHSIIAVTGHLAVDYRRPVPLNRPIHLEAREVRLSGRRRFREAEIMDGKGQVLAQGQGIFITINPEKMFARSGE
jgi:uncharacterized protein (TIGR00369 family)